MTSRGIAFIERQVQAGKPFYLQLSHYGGRSRADAKPETFERVLELGLARNDRNMEAAAVALDMDVTIGLLLDALEKLNIANNTYVIYTADHGTPGRNGPLQGGKWHINGGGPEAHGYDEGDGDIGNEYAHEYGDPNPADIFGMAKRAVAFMEKNKQANKPFFIQMSWHALHAPQNAMKETLAKYAQRMNSSAGEKRVGSAAIAENLDTGVGMVVDAIDRLGLADNTFVIYMSDNGSGGGGGKGDGGRGRRAGLAGGKGGVWEGGIRSPLIIRGPGVAANSWCHERVVGYDFFPTYCQWAGIPASKLPRGIEGGSIVGLLDDGKGTVERQREEMVFHFPHYQGGDGPHSALFFGNHKLMKFYEDNRLALFDIAADISEQNDLSQQMPQKVKELDGLLVKYLHDVDAQMAIPNPQYDPNQAPAARKRGGSGKTKGDKGAKRKKGVTQQPTREREVVYGTPISFGTVLSQDADCHYRIVLEGRDASFS